MLFLMLSPLLVIYVQSILFSSIKFFNYLLSCSTLSSLLMTVSKTWPLFKLFLTNLVFCSVAFLNLLWSSCNFPLSLKFSASSWVENFCLKSTKLVCTCSNLDLRLIFSYYWCSISLFLVVISLVSSLSSCSVTSSATSTVL